MRLGGSRGGNAHRRQRLPHDLRARSRLLNRHAGVRRNATLPAGLTMTHDLATQDPTEAGWLARIVENFADPSRYAAYATWLDDRDPAAARVVRAYASHAFEGSDVPDPCAGRTDAWHRMLGMNFDLSDGRSWHAAIRDLDEEVQRALFRWVRPIVGLVAERCPDPDIPLGASKFLGAPHLPAAFGWPECAEGPLRFQAQLDLAELRTTVATARYALPPAGRVVLFAFDDDGETGVQPGVVERGTDGKYQEIPDLTHVAYVAADVALVRTDIPAATAPWDKVDRSCRITLLEGLDLPLAGDVPDDRLDEAEDWLYDLRGGWTHKWMGYPVHGRTTNTSPGPDWVNLLTLGSDDTTGWSWCDGEHLDVYVHGDGIRNATFRPFYGYAA